MASYIFCRFWPGFTDLFPFDKFNHLDEGDIDRELHGWAKQEYKKHRRAIFQTRKVRLANAKAALAKQSRRKLIPPRDVNNLGRPPTGFGEFRRRALQVDCCSSLVQRAGSFLGWFENGSGLVGEPGRVVSSRVWLRQVEENARAVELAVWGLNNGVANGKESALDCLPAVFSAIPASELNEQQQYTAQFYIDDIAEGGTPKLEMHGKIADKARRMIRTAVRKLDGMNLKKPAKISVDSKAVAYLIDHQEATHSQVAEAIGCNEKSLTAARCPNYFASRARIRTPERHIRGTKGSDSELEAWIEE